MNVLIADDNQTNRVILARMVKAAGGASVCVEDGPAALDSIARSLPDLVFLDISMPGMDGFQVIRAIGETHGRVEFPVYAVSAHTTDSIAARCADSGFAGFITKPVSLAQISSLLAQRESDLADEHPPPDPQDE